MTYVSSNNCLFNMHAIICMPTKLDICENTDKTFDDVFYVNLKYVVIFPSRLRLKGILKFIHVWQPKLVDLLRYYDVCRQNSGAMM